MEKNVRSPKVTHVSWGRIDVEGRKVFKDAKVFPGGAREWDWNETGTRHETGIQPGDVEELIERGATVVVLSNGMHGELQVNPETVKLLNERHIPAHVLETEEAVKLYNDLAEKERPAGLFHSTC